MIEINLTDKVGAKEMFKVILSNNMPFLPITLFPEEIAKKLLDRTAELIDDERKVKIIFDDFSTIREIYGTSVICKEKQTKILIEGYSTMSTAYPIKENFYIEKEAKKVSQTQGTTRDKITKRVSYGFHCFLNENGEKDFSSYVSVKERKSNSDSSIVDIDPTDYVENVLNFTPPESHDLYNFIATNYDENYPYIVQFFIGEGIVKN